MDKSIVRAMNQYPVSTVGVGVDVADAADVVVMATLYVFVNDEEMHDQHHVQYELRMLSLPVQG